MKARVKATGEIVEVEEYHKYLETGWKYRDNAGTLYKPSALDFSDEAVIGYWTRLEHQYAGMAMNALLLTNNIRNGDLEGMRECNTNAMAIAHALVEKLKEKVVRSYCNMKICITISEMSQLQWHLGEGNIKQRSFIVDIPNESLPQGLQDFFKTREEELMFKKFSNLDSITIVEE